MSRTGSGWAAGGGASAARGGAPVCGPRAAARLTAALAPALLLAASGCAYWRPARIEVTPPAGPILDRKMNAIQAVAVNEKGRPLGNVTLSWSAAPADVVEMTPAGAFRCLQTGDAEVVVTAREVRAAVPVKCRIPTEIAMPPSVRLVLGEAAPPLRPRALGEGARPLDDVPVPVSSSDPAIVRMEEDRPVPVAIGRVTLRGALGDVVAVTPAVVVEAIAAGRLALEDGAARSFTLEAGTYELTIDVQPVVRSSQGVTVSWDGTSCPAQLEAQSHRLTCLVPDRAVLTVKNPATLGLGARVSGTIGLYKVPPS
jgi:hypothetical protein